jgi:hypothetical protein
MEESTMTTAMKISQKYIASVAGALALALPGAAFAASAPQSLSAHAQSTTAAAGTDKKDTDKATSKDKDKDAKKAPKKSKDAKKAEPKSAR